MPIKKNVVELSLRPESAEFLYLEIRSQTAMEYAPKAEMILDDLRAALRQTEEGRSILQKYEDM